MACSVDWAAAGSWAQAAAGAAQAGAVLWAASKGADVFKSWRKQKIEERRMEAAERILTLAYRIQQVFSSIRSPFMAASELAAAEAALTERDAFPPGATESERRRISHAEAVYKRINGFAKDWDELLAVIPIATALFGVKLEVHLRALWSQRSTVSVAAGAYADRPGVDEDFNEKIKRDLWEGWTIGGKPNEVTEAIAAAVKGLEDQLLPILREEPPENPKALANV